MDAIEKAVLYAMAAPAAAGVAVAASSKALGASWGTAKWVGAGAALIGLLAVVAGAHGNALQAQTTPVT